MSSHRSRSRWWTGGGCLLVGVVLGGLAAMTTVAQRRERAFVAALDQATRVVAQARADDGAQWAPDAQDAADTALRAAQVGLRVEQSRFLPLRDFTASAGHVAIALSAGRRAGAQTSLYRAAARDAAARSVAAASDAVDRAVTLHRALPLPETTRAHLSRTREALAAARALFREGEYRTARARATDARRTAHLVADDATALVARFTDPARLDTWDRWIDQTVAWTRQTGRVAIVVSKAAHELRVYRDGRVVHRFPVDLGFNWTADKTRAGDGATPEGRYHVARVKGRGETSYHRALLIDYPNADDHAAFARAQRTGRVPHGARIGGLIEIHGAGGLATDWTDGCVALENHHLGQLVDLVAVGTPVTIVGASGPAELDARLGHTADAVGDAP